MAAIVKPIEAKAIHQIQSGQVIVDLCSVVKELVENSLDAGANSIEVRFKNNGLDEIEVQDNGLGIAAINYESVALKHYTSKLSTYDDLSSLQTFGFRGEALSSLCALSTFSIATAQAEEAPKGHRLEFEMSGKLKSTAVVACQKGTIATVQNLFEKLPVRRKELAKNIKREYGKVLGLLHAYACISTNVKFIVKNAVAKGKSMTVFATKSNGTTRENIANVYGAKTLSALISLDLDLDFQHPLTQKDQDEPHLRTVAVKGHISKPVFGEGRLTPDRQMFFVNGRPCGLPQIAKAINEVYKSFNVSQSPFVCADFQMDTNSYDVNVSPDKRTILLHDAAALIESLKESLTDLFDRQDQTVPHAHVRNSKLPAFKNLTFSRETSGNSSQGSPDIDEPKTGKTHEDTDANDIVQAESPTESNRLLHDHFRNVTSTRERPDVVRSERDLAKLEREQARIASRVASFLAKQEERITSIDQEDFGPLGDKSDQADDMSDTSSEQPITADQIHVRDFNARMAEQESRKYLSFQDTSSENTPTAEESIATLSPLHQKDAPGIVQNAFHRMRPKRAVPEVATITIGDKTITRMIGSKLSQDDDQQTKSADLSGAQDALGVSKGAFSQGLLQFAAPGTQLREIGEAHVRTTRLVNQEDNLEEDQRSSVGRPDDPGDSSDVSEDTDQLWSDTIIGNPITNDHDITEDEEKAAEEKRVAELIRVAESTAAQQSNQGEKRAMQALKGARAKDSVVSLAVEVELDLTELTAAVMSYKQRRESDTVDTHVDLREEQTADTIEERLSLSVSKFDFLQMHIVGQFNLGFILAVRHRCAEIAGESAHDRDELFIIDQHASDEKYNFERLQAETTVSNQRMVRPAVLELTAVEEEVVIDNISALEKNGFVVEIDNSGDTEVGQRCRLVSLPLSKEVVFGTKDLDELIHLLAEAPMLNDSSRVPRPSKVRKMFAMRACRSSVMIGKTLSHKQMSSLLQHMGSIDKPWNCPHGRPTMRHLASLDQFDDIMWKERDGVYPGDDYRASGSKSASGVWKSYME